VTAAVPSSERRWRFLCGAMVDWRIL